MMKLVIAEKPALGMIIAQAIGIHARQDGYIQCNDDTVVTWCIGHILENSPPEAYDEKYAKWQFEHLPMQLRPLRLQIKTATKKQFDTVKRLLSEASEVIHAGDFDDEGQLLVDEVIEFCNFNGQVRRLIVNDLNVSAVQKALKDLQPNENYQGMSKKALARSQADFIYGMNLSRAYTLMARNKGHDGVFSVGRVQTPTLGLIVRRYIENKSHKSIFYHTLDGQFSFAKGIPLKMEITEELAGNEEKRIYDKEKAEAIKAACDGKPAKVVSTELTVEKKAAPLPFALLDLQAQMNNKYGLSADQTLKITQSLREKHKAITYNRSDCRYLTTEQLADAPATLNFIQIIFENINTDILDTSKPSRAFDDEKVTAHTGIIPVAASFKLQDLSPEEKQVYEAIVKQYLVQFCPPKTSNKCVVHVSCADYQFSQSASQVTDKGWAAILEDASEPSEDQEESKEVDYEVLKAIENGTEGSCEKITVTAQKTKPQPIYTEATLLKDLQRIAKYVVDPKIKELLIKKDEGRIGENGGIGTPATRSAIIKNLNDKGYYEYQGKKLIPTQKGLDFIAALPEALTRPDLTALWYEQQLDIEAGSRSVDDFLNGLDNFINEEVKAARQANIAGKEAIQCPVCKAGIMKVRKSANGSFLGCTNYPECKHTQALLNDKPLPPCPCCGKPLRVNSKAISCAQEDCKFILWKTVASKALTTAQILDILEKGKTKKIKGFLSKAGKEFDASLVLDKDKRSVFMKFEDQPKKDKATS